jgi:uncharacterized RmlC-like cupin family protein
MSLENVSIASAALMCNKSGCSALWQHEVEIYGEDFRFCNHHHAELEPTLILLAGVDDPELVGASS